jgi:dsDNA-specific endonuclease/ATPase MutS2
LHTFRPQDIPDLIDHYILECIRCGFASIRIIHGKGTGFQKKRIHELLRSHPRVRSFADAPAEAGGWGATLVELTTHETER